MTVAQSPDDFTPEELTTWAAFATMLEWLPPALSAPLVRDAELTHFEFGILYALASAPHRALTMTTLAGYANSTPSRLTRAASRLERRGWLERRPDASDGRATIVALTEQGATRVAQAMGPHVENVRRLVFASLTATQVKQLRTISERINAAIRESPGWPAPGGSHGR